MSTQTQAIRKDLGRLADEAQELITDTVDRAGEKAGETRQRLTATMERGRDMCGRVRDQAVEGAKAAHHAVHEHPYQAIAIACGVGLFIGYLLTHRRSRDA
jgi:ElaB/YqjD/DUF883 family membrane-anchored ribosome-binding protein